MKSVMIGAKENAVWSVRWSLHCFELPASPWFSFANSDHSENLIYSDAGQIQLDSSPNSWYTIMTSFTCCISIVVSNSCGSSIFPAYRESALVKSMPSSLSPLVWIRLVQPWHLILFRLRLSTKPQRLPPPSISNSGNVLGNHLAGSNKPGCWSSFVSFCKDKRSALRTIHMDSRHYPQRVGLKIGRQNSGTVSWVLRD